VSAQPPQEPSTQLAVVPSTDYLTAIPWKSGDRFLIERQMVHGNGYFTFKGKRYGNGFKYHFKAAMRALLPFIDWNRWFTLLIDSFCDYEETGVMGPASSGKTFAGAVFIYTFFQIHPKGSSSIISTTTRDGLQLRVFGAIKSLHNKAKERRPWLSGRVIDSRSMLTGADSDDEAQDFRNGILGVACFLSGTLVDTPYGPVPIETLKVGDSVFNASGIGTVTETFVSKSHKILRVTLSDGRYVDCTEEHPFFTQRGWVKAIDLCTFDMVLSANESVQILRDRFVGPLSEQEVLLGGLQQFSSNQKMRRVQFGFQSDKEVRNKTPFNWEVLLKGVRRKMGIKEERAASRNNGSQVSALQKIDTKIAFQHEVLLSALQVFADSDALQVLRKLVYFKKGVTLKAKKHVLLQILQSERDDKEEAQKWYRSNTGGTNGLETVSTGDLEHESHERKGYKQQKRIFQARRCVSGDKTGRGNRRWSSQDTGEQAKRFGKEQDIGGTRVDRVEILESRGSGGFGSSESGHSVYNLSVSGHPSYSVNGMLVHNCRSGGHFQGISNYVGIKNDHVLLVADEASLMETGFLDSVSNLRKGGKKTWKLIALGNPKDRNDPLGHICEPAASIGGWEGLLWEEKTRSWPTRHPKGLAIQLCGTDSPNFDYPRGLNPHVGLITPEQIEVDLQYYGKDSLRYSMMNLGMMPRDGEKRRIVTLSLCESNQAYEEAVWGTTPLVRVLGIDAAYSAVGGDRTVLTDLQFGPDAFGNIVISFAEPQTVIPTSAKTTLEVQDQIATYVMEYAKKRGIPPENVGFDSTGRGTLMSAFARLWSVAVIPIEFGGRPPERPVRLGATEMEEDAYTNMVTALWFASRLVIESKQLRQLSRDCATEGSFREWGIQGKGRRVFVEPKDETKKRMGRSPDLWDSLVTAIEVARRRGFQIAPGSGVGFQKRTVPNWMLDRQKMLRDQERRVELRSA